MPRRRPYDPAALDDVIAVAERVLDHATLKQAGMPASTLVHRIRPDGPWQRILPGVLITHSGHPSRRERLLAAARFCGPESVITGWAALRELGIQAAARHTEVQCLVPETRQRKGHGFVLVERTRRMPDPVLRQGLRLAPLPRAVVDAARRSESLDDVRELVAEVVQRGLCTVEQLREEVQRAARARTALSRTVLLEMEAGVRSVAEAKAKAVFARQGIPAAEWNAEVHGPDGELIARADAYWEDVAAALELDSMAWHLRPKAYRRTQRRQRAMTSRGILVLPVAPVDVLSDELRFCAEVRAFLAEARRRVPPEGLFVRRAAA